MKLEVGMYARLDGKIGKIIEVCRCEQCESRGYYEPTIEYAHGERDYVSVYWKNNLIASHNIIDLIEVGDIIITKHSGLGKEFVEIINSETSLEFLKSYFKEKSLDLVEVLTKEQFESMSYKVKE